jgi:hypothetical protein
MRQNLKANLDNNLDTLEISFSTFTRLDSARHIYLHFHFYQLEKGSITFRYGGPNDVLPTEFTTMIEFRDEDKNHIYIKDFHRISPFYPGEVFIRAGAE